MPGARQRKPSGAAASAASAPSPAASGTSVTPNNNRSAQGHHGHGGQGNVLLSLQVLVGMPAIVIIVLGLHVVCDMNPHHACKPWGWSATDIVDGIGTWEQWLSWPAVGAVLGWLAFHAVLHIVLPGAVVEGVELGDGSRLKYKINGFGALVATIAVVAAVEVSGVASVAWIADNLTQIIGSTTVIVLAFCFFLYAKALIQGTGVAPLATGNPLYDFWHGRQLNPRIGSFDLKYFCELRPGMIGWGLLNVAMARKQALLTGSVSPAMAFVVICQGIYIADSLWFERCILTTMDIVSDGFGFMLAYGDLAWVPFTFSMHARYLLHNPVHLHPAALAALVVLFVAGFTIFRASNSQKDAFRRDPNAPQFKGWRFIQTKRGTKLLASGYWGLSRHANYLGDWLHSLSWALACGFTSPVPYFYSIYLGSLLIHRQMRDDHKCAAKYGEDWATYCKLVPWRIVPWVY